MFWTVFSSMLILAYLIGSLLNLGIIIARWERAVPNPKPSDYWFSVVACLLSWVTFGIFLVVAYEEATG